MHSSPRRNDPQIQLLALGHCKLPNRAWDAAQPQRHSCDILSPRSVSGGNYTGSFCVDYDDVIEANLAVLRQLTTCRKCRF